MTAGDEGAGRPAVGALKRPERRRFPDERWEQAERSPLDPALHTVQLLLADGASALRRLDLWQRAHGHARVRSAGARGATGREPPGGARSEEACLALECRVRCSRGAAAALAHAPPRGRHEWRGVARYRGRRRGRGLGFRVREHGADATGTADAAGPATGARPGPGARALPRASARWCLFRQSASFSCQPSCHLS